MTQTKVRPEPIEVLKGIAQFGGEVFDPQGLATPRLARHLGKYATAVVSAVLVQLEKKDLVERDCVGKRTYSIKLTTSGRKNVVGYKASISGSNAASKKADASHGATVLDPHSFTSNKGVVMRYGKKLLEDSHQHETMATELDGVATKSVNAVDLVSAAVEHAKNLCILFGFNPTEFGLTDFKD